MKTVSQYKRIRVPKRSGGMRVIDIPSRELKANQKDLLRRLKPYVPNSPHLHAYCKRKSTRTNAQALLLGRPSNERAPSCVLQMDIQDFFGSINRSRVLAALKLRKVPKDLLEEVAETCFRTKRVPTLRGSREVTYLPQGAPTSPVLAHTHLFTLVPGILGALRAGDRVSSLYEVKMSIYCDNITIAADTPDIRHLVHILDAILHNEGLRLRREKTSFRRRPSRRIVCGVQISEEGIGPPRRYWRNLRADIFNAYSDLRAGLVPAGFYLEDKARKRIRACLPAGASPKDPMGEKAKKVWEEVRHRKREIPFKTWRGRISHIQSLNREKGKKMLALYNQMKEAHESEIQNNIRGRQSAPVPRPE